MNKTLIFLLIITLTGLFFYSFRLKETQLFRDDTARDTLKVLRIWQNKELTLIGPPISFTQRTTKEAYLGSLFLYIGLIGLILVNWDPIGAVLPNTFFFILSIPLFYLLVAKLSDSFWKKVIATILYTLSPITVTHARFFWNPNLIIPASALFWYLVLKETKSRFGAIFHYFFAGIVAGLIFNFHYLVAFPLFIYIFILIFSKQVIKSFSILVGLIVGILPILIFELRNNFYLTKALVDNLFLGRGPEIPPLIDGVYHFFNIFWSIFGLKQAEIDFPRLFVQDALNQTLLLFFSLIIFLAILVRIKSSFKYKMDKIPSLLWPVIVVGILQTIYFSSGDTIRFRYLFSVFPIVIWMIVNFLYLFKKGLIIFLLFIPTIVTSIVIITGQPSLQKNFISLSKIEDVCQEIVKDDPSGSYNITENLKGDARAMSFRYCVTKDAKVKPADELSYNNLTTLYVISPSEDKIYKENRWEFYASGPWRLANTTDFGEVKLFKFKKEIDEEN